MTTSVSFSNSILISLPKECPKDGHPLMASCTYVGPGGPWLYGPLGAPGGPGGPGGPWGPGGPCGPPIGETGP